jgi:hypothetical protein
VSRPPLSVIIAVRSGLEEAEAALEALIPQARSTGTEVLVVGPVDGNAPDPIRLVRIDDADIFRLRLAGIREARGEVVAIGEDHAVPREDWCEAVLRAHAEHPEAPAVVGCLVNASDGSVSARGNFLSFAAPFQPPMRELPPLRPPPVSTLSLKREALAEVDGHVGRFETALVPRLSAEGRMVPDARIVVDHCQDHGMAWAIANGFHAARAAYGYLCRELGAAERLRQARWSILNWPRRVVRDAQAACGGQAGHRRDIAVAGLIGIGIGVGGAVGSIAGSGRSPTLVA